MNIFKKLTAGIIVSAMSLGMATTYVGADSTSYYRGDVDGNGIVDIADLAYMANFLNGNKGSANDYMSQRLDVDMSGIIDILDQNMLSQILMGSITYDTIDYEISNVGIPEQSTIYYKKFDAQTGVQIGTAYHLDPVSAIPDYAPRGIIGTDDRVIDYSNSGVVKISTPSKGLGSGFIVADNLILTAAHVVYGETNINYTLFNSNGTVKATYSAASYHVPLNYISSSNDNDNDNYDYALIVVNQNLSRYKSINLGVARDKLKNNITSSIYLNYASKLGIYVTGFVSYTGYTGIGNLTNNYLLDMGLDYNTDTDGGESGSPVYVKTSNGDMIAIGIHNGKATSTYNYGRRIDTNVLQFVYYNPNL